MLVWECELSHRSVHLGRAGSQSKSWCCTERTEKGREEQPLTGCSWVSRTSRLWYLWAPRAQQKSKQVMDRQMGRRLDRQINGWGYRWIDRQMDEGVNRWMDDCMDD